MIPNWLASIPIALVIVGISTSCAFRQKKVEREVKADAPINCATAEGDIRVLHHEKTHVAQQVLEGATALAPAGIVMGLVTGTETTKLKVGVGEYNKMIDKRIADIQRTCGVT